MEQESNEQAREQEKQILKKGWFLDINLINIEINIEINCKEKHSESEESLYSTENIHEEIENV